MVTLPPSALRSLYERLVSSNETFRARLGRPLTYAEKVLFAHLDDPAGRGGG